MLYEVITGTIATGDNTDLCSGDGVPDVIGIDLSGSGGSFSRYIVTDTAGLIIDLPGGSPPFDFEGT